MLACGSGKHDPTAHVSHHEHARAVASEHVHASAATAHRHDASAPSERANADLAHAAAHKCSACASCCLGAAVPTATLSFEPIALPDFFAPLAARMLAAYVTEGLERPPRTFLA